MSELLLIGRHENYVGDYLCLLNNNNNNNNKLQLVCHPVAVVILHVYKI